MKLSHLLISAFISISYFSAFNCFGQENPNHIYADHSDKKARTGKEVFDRLNRYFKPLNCDDKSAHIWLKTYSNPKDFSAHVVRVLPMLDYVSREFERSKLPSEYALVPFIESRYNPSTKSKSGPGGLWQMISSTAIHLGIKVNAQYDGRYSPIDSTRGAIKYFTELGKNFTGWHTILMAYNAGGSRLRYAMKKQGLKTADIQNKLPTGLDNHTYAYVRKIQAIACLIAEPARYNITLPDSIEFTPLSIFELGKEFTTLKDVGHKLNIPDHVLIELNPSYRYLKQSNSVPGHILVPENYLETYQGLSDASN